MRVTVDDFALMVNDFAVVANFRFTPADLEEVAYLITLEVDDLYETINDQYEIHAEMLGAGIKIDASNQGLLEEVRVRGATPDLIKRANHLLDDGAYGLPCEAQPARQKRRPAPLPIARRRPSQGRSREARSRATRVSGSRRVVSRSAGGGSSGDDDGPGEPEPPARGKQVNGPVGSVQLGQRLSSRGSTPAIAQSGSRSARPGSASPRPHVDPWRLDRGPRRPPHVTTAPVNHDKGGRHDDDRYCAAT